MLEVNVFKLFESSLDEKHKTDANAYIDKCSERADESAEGYLRDAFAYRAGQFLSFKIPHAGMVLTRSYSLSSSPDCDAWELGPDGTWRHVRAPGGFSCQQELQRLALERSRSDRPEVAH